MIITIDGPTASGKSTLARALAKELSIYYLYTGLLYRALGYILITHYGYSQDDLTQPKLEDIDQLFSSGLISYCFDDARGEHIFYKGEDITGFLKSLDVDRWASRISAHAQVRALMVGFQRLLAQQMSLIADGRDCGTVVFPSADVKFFLTADKAIRAMRWQKDQKEAGHLFTLEEAMTALMERDNRDTRRSVSPCKPAGDAFIIDNSRMDVEQTVALCLTFIRGNPHEVET